MGPPDRWLGSAIRQPLRGNAKNTFAAPDRPDRKEKARFVLEKAQLIRQFNCSDQRKPCAGWGPIMKAALGQKAISIIDELSGA